jgi:hypothetical protein
MAINKKLTLFDHNNANDNINISHKYLKEKGHMVGEVIFKKLGTDEVLFVRRNKVIIAGSQFMAMKAFDLPELVHLPTYNESLSLDESVPHGTNPTNIPKVCLFCCGTQGCGPENSQVYPVDYTGRIAPAGDLVPFRYCLPQNDLTSAERAKYFGRKTLSDRYAYYFKAFESDPVMYMRYVDGTPIEPTVYESENDSDAETFVEMQLRVTKDDFRDYFRATTSINDARINSISLLTAWYTQGEGYKWYQDIIPLTQLNIPNEPLIDLTKGIDITYHVYF